MASQLFYCIIWPHVSSPSELIALCEEHLTNYPETSKKIVVFGRCKDISAKDHDRMWHPSGAVLDYDLSIATEIPR